ncbi:MAG: hypothetical protein EHM70_22530 [Chloroflexota bacterium]|nr:MAG: hypothetical protein EHM70_22530 [Chloroflexota bacterium]
MQKPDASDLGNKLFALGCLFFLLLSQGSRAIPAPVMARAEFRRYKKTALRIVLPKVPDENAAVFIVSDDSVHLTGLLTSVIALDDRGVAFTADPAPTLTLHGVTSQYRRWEAYPNGPLLSMVKIYYLWPDGQIHSGWFVLDVTFEDDTWISFAPDDDDLLDPVGPWAATLVTLKLSGAHVSQAGVNWNTCPFDRRVCGLGNFSEGGYGLTASLLEGGSAPGHPMYGYLFGWEIYPEKILRVSDYDPNSDQPTAAGGIQ